MKNIELIRKEREDQIEKWGDPEKDHIRNPSFQLSLAASVLCRPDMYPSTSKCPDGWDINIWNNIINKPFEERLVIAAALIIAELDRLDYVNS